MQGGSLISLIIIVSRIHSNDQSLRDGLSWVTYVTGRYKVTLNIIYFFRVRCTSSRFILLVLAFSSISLSYFNLAVPMHKCSRGHSCMTNVFFIALLNGTCSLRFMITVKTFWKWSAIKWNSTNNKDLLTNIEYDEERYSLMQSAVLDGDGNS